MESLKKNVQNDLTSIKVISYLYHSASPSLSLSSWNAKSSAYLTRGGDRGGLGKESEMINGHGKVKDRKSQGQEKCDDREWILREVMGQG